ncbi:hypothetical protein E2C01_021320 [Portunus trituberculatus]|uniref:Uncharacterized protein n=1 Tax=Portunus trituberculatus TaxID=210409 RepID=A0A5B7E4M2_PORTR|nr:hypothetical protein [Portunus trituberculatus]
MGATACAKSTQHARHLHTHEHWQRAQSTSPLAHTLDTNYLTQKSSQTSQEKKKQVVKRMNLEERFGNGVLPQV